MYMNRQEFRRINFLVSAYNSVYTYNLIFGHF